MIRPLALAVLLLVPTPARGAGLGLDLQAYPAGLIGTGRVARAAGAGELALHLGYNATDRRDWGEHEDETGGGPGFGLAWRHPWRSGSRWVFGARADLWFLQIDWDEELRSGRTDVTVLQPTAHVGHGWMMGETVALVAHVALGAEINVNTQGESVGQGLILLLGLTATTSP